MAKSSALNLNLPPLDDLFSTQESRDEAKLTKIHDIPLSEIDDFPDHPFQVKLDADMDNLVASIRENGVLVPVILRKKEDGRYELVSRHRRKKPAGLRVWKPSAQRCRTSPALKPSLKWWTAICNARSFSPAKRRFPIKCGWRR